MLQLNSLTRLVKKKKRVGRGGSRGGTSGRGGKGQTARSGGATRPGFEGGQTPLVRRSPKRGFSNHPFMKEVDIVNLEQLDVFEAGAQIDRNSLVEMGILKSKKSSQGKLLQLKILGRGELSKKLTIIAHSFSESAKKSIESLGGEARLIKES